MNNILVSVIMPAYNSEKYIGEAIQSVINQTYTNWELIVINDCSTDNTKQIVERFIETDSRILLLNNERNSGVAISRNNGIDKAKGECIALLDSDDIWLPDKIEKQLEIYEKGATIVYCSYDFIDENSILTGKGFKVKSKTNYNQMLKRNEIGCSTVLIDAEICKEQKFSTEYYHEDYVMWMCILERGASAEGITESLVHYRKYIGSRSDNKIFAAKQRWIIYRDALNIAFLKRVLCFSIYAINGLIKHF